MSENNVDIVVRVQQLTTQAFQQIQEELKKIEGHAHDTAHEAEGLSHTIEALTGAFGHFGEGGEVLAGHLETITGKMEGLGKSAGVLGPVGLGLAAVAAAAVGVGLAVYEGAEKFGEFIQETVDAGAHLLDLSKKTGVSVEALAEFKDAGEHVGIGLESITNAVYRMEVGLGTGSKKITDALEAIGLDIKELQRLSPEEAFRKIVEALHNTTDANVQAAAGQAIFSRGFREMKGLVTGDLDELIQRFHDLGGGFTTDMARAAKAVQDSELDMATAFEAIKVQIAGAFLPVIGAVLKDFVDAWIAAMRTSGVSAADFKDVVNTVSAVVVQNLGGMLLVLGEFLHTGADVARFLVQMGDGAAKLATALPLSDAQVNKLSQTMFDAGSEMHVMADGADKLSNVVTTLGLKLGTTTGEMLKNVASGKQEWGPTIEDLTDKHKKLGDAADGASDKIKGLADALEKTVQQAAKTANQIDDGTVVIGKFGTTQEQVNAQMWKGIEALDALGQHGTPVYDQLVRLAFATENWRAGIGKQKEGIDDVIKSLDKVAGVLVDMHAELARGDVIIGAYANRLNTLPEIAKILGLKELPRDLQNADAAFDSSMTKMNDAFHAFGLTSQQELQQTAIKAQQNFQIVAQSGIATDEQLTAAWQQMVDAELAATDTWRARVVQVIETIGTSFDDNFGKVLSGQESFKDGVLNIWHDLQKGIGDILSQIVKQFEEMFIAKITASLLGNSSVWAGIIGTALSSGAQAGVANAATGSAVQSGFNYAGLATGAGGTSGAAAAIAAGGWGAAAGPVAGGIVGWKVGQATGNAAEGAAAGAATGAAVGSIVPGGGTLVGAGVGAVIGAWGAHEANEDARNQMVAIRDDLKQTFGSLDAVRQAAQAVGVNIDQAFQDIGRGVQGVKDFNAVVQQFHDKFTALDGALKHYGLTLDQVEELGKSAQDQMADSAKTIASYYTALTGAGASPDATLKLMATDLNNLLAQAIATGTKLPATLEPYLDRMNELGLITDANKSKLLGLTDQNTVDLQGLTQIANEFGLSLDQLGPKFNAAKISADAQDITTKFEKLQDAGADVGGVLEAMKPKIQDLVLASRKYGTELPADMATMVDFLVKQGDLVDENGQKLTDLSGVKFGQPMADQFQPVTDAIHQLIDVLTGKNPNSLPGALQDGINQMQGIASRTDIRIPIKYDYETIGTPPSDIGGRIPGAASGIYATGARGVATWFGEGGVPELGGPVDFMSQVLAQAQRLNGGGQGTTINVVIDAKGGFFESPADQQRFADKVSAAIMAKLSLRQRLNAA